MEINCEIENYYYNGKYIQMRTGQKCAKKTAIL